MSDEITRLVTTRKCGCNAFGRFGRVCLPVCLCVCPVRTTLMYELDLDILKICLSTKVNFLHQVFQEYEQDTQTHRQSGKRTDRRDRTNYSRISAW